MFSHTLKRIAVATVMVGGLSWASGNSAEAVEPGRIGPGVIGPGVIGVKVIPAPQHETMFRDAISDSRQRSEQTRHDPHLETFRALAVSSPHLTDTARFGRRLEVRGQATPSSALERTRDLVLRYWDAPQAASGNATVFRAAAQLTSVQ
jgi:hypothetical protein